MSDRYEPRQNEEHATADEAMCQKWVGPIWKTGGETCVCKLRADHADGRFGPDHECSCGAWFVDAVAKKWASEGRNT